jgi:alpha-L-fucosidase
LYSLLGRGEWAMYRERIPVDEYSQLANEFTAEKFDADTWAQLAVDAGAKYMVFTTRHHDGFCLYDSHFSDCHLNQKPLPGATSWRSMSKPVAEPV